MKMNKKKALSVATVCFALFVSLAVLFAFFLPERKETAYAQEVSSCWTDTKSGEIGYQWNSAGRITQNTADQGWITAGTANGTSYDFFVNDYYNLSGQTDYTVSVHIQGTSAVDGGAQNCLYGVVPWYIDGDNYLCVYAEWWETRNEVKEMRQVRIRGRVNGNEYVSGDFWTDNIRYSPSAGLDLIVQRNGDSISFSIPSKSDSATISGISSVSGTVKTGVYGVNDPGGVFSNFNVALAGEASYTPTEQVNESYCAEYLWKASNADTYAYSDGTVIQAVENNSGNFYLNGQWNVMGNHYTLTASFSDAKMTSAEIGAVSGEFYYGIVPWYRDADNYVYCIAKWRKGWDISLDVSGRINGEDLGWDSTGWTRNFYPSEGFSMSVLRNENTFTVSVNGASASRTIAGLSGATNASTDRCGIVLNGRKGATASSFRVANHYVADGSAIGYAYKSTNAAKSGYGLTTLGVIQSFEDNYMNFYLKGETLGSNKGYSVSASMRTYDANAAVSMGVVPWYVNENNYIVGYAVFNGNVGAGTLEVLFTGKIDGVNQGFQQIFAQAVSARSTDNIRLDVERLGDTFTGIVYVNGAKLVEGSKYFAVSQTDTNSAQYGVYGNSTSVEFTDITYRKEGISVNMELGQNMSMKYYVDSDLVSGKSGVYAKVVFNNATTDIGYVVADDGKFVFTFDKLSPQLLTKNISFTVYDSSSNLITCRPVYTARDYCMSLLSTYPDNVALRNLVSDLLKYGDEAQKYTGTDTENLASANMSEQQRAYGTAYTTPSKSMGITDTGVDTSALWKGANVYFDNNVSLAFAFTTDDVENLVVNVNGVNYTKANFKEAYYSPSGEFAFYVLYVPVAPANYDREYVATFYEGGIQVGRSLSYSVNAYVAAQADSATMGDLVRALYSYGASAAAYNA